MLSPFCGNPSEQVPGRLLKANVTGDNRDSTEIPSGRGFESNRLIATVENFTIGASLSQLRAVIASRTTVFRAVKSLREGGRVLYAKHQCCDGVTAEDQRVESNDESLSRMTALLTGGKICST